MVRRRAGLSALAVAAVCATGSIVYAQPLYEQQPGAGDQQQQPGYPPPADQQQPPGYPEQQPGYPQQQPGYPPPAAEYAPPAPYQPPAEYAPASNYGPTNQQQSYYSAPPAALPNHQRGFLILPYFGGNSLLGSSGAGRTIGIHAGGIVGLRFGRTEGKDGTNFVFSTNAEGSLDWCNPTDVPSYMTSPLEMHMIFAFSPLVHLILPSAYNTELVAGPKLGYWIRTFQYDQTGTGLYPTTSSYSESTIGVVLGLTLGAFYGMGDIFSLGALFNFDLRVPGSCSVGTGSSSSYSDTCPAGPSLKVFTFSAAALF